MSESVLSGWYAWTSHGVPLQVLLSLQLVEQLRQEFNAHPGSGAEMGGLLIGSKHSGVTRIFECISLPPDLNVDERRFSPPEWWLNEVFGLRASDRTVVGYFRSDWDHLIRLRQDDLSLMQQRFKDPSSVSLVIAPSIGSGVQAGFFCWRGDTIAVNPHLTFPLSAAELASNHWPIESQEFWGEKIGRSLSDLFKSYWKISAKIAAALVLAAVLAALVVSRWTEWTGRPAGLQLHVRSDNTRFWLSWNPHAPAVEHAKQADLLVWDSSRAEADGDTEPLVLPVPVGILHSGTMTYTSFAPAQKVQFRLDVIDEAGRLRSEAAISRSPAPAHLAQFSPAQPVVKPPRPSRIAHDSTPPAKEKIVRPQFSPPQLVSQAEPPARIVILEPPADVSGVGEAQSRSSMLADSGRPLPRPSIPDSPAPKNNSRPLPPPARLANAALPGMITITSEPSGAEVQINGNPAGMTPVAVQISPVGLGFTITVEKEGYLKWSLQTFATDKPSALHAALQGSR